MLARRNPILLSYVRGGFGIGSKHQKHQSYCPAPYLYRFPWKRGGTSVIAKYMHTLGTLPTGLEVPFRLPEFHGNYIRQHVPEELEDWLRCVVYDPAETIMSNMEVFMERMQNAPEVSSRRTVFTRAQLLDCRNVHAPLQKAFEEFGVEIPVIAVRAAASNNRIREELLDVCFAYHETVSQIGSTPHRRWAATACLPDQQQQEQTSISGDGLHQRQLPSSSAVDGSNHLSPQQQEVIGKTLSSVLSFPVSVTGNETEQHHQQQEIPRAAPDEVLATKLLTTLAEGCHKAKQGQSNAAATRLLESALKFCNDDPKLSCSTHANLSSAYSAGGDFDKAQLHAREAVLRDRSNPRAFAAWTVATALQDNLDEALQISSDALEEHPESPVLQQVHEQVCRASTGRVTTPEDKRQKRYVLQSQADEGLRRSAGRVFDHSFETAWDVTGTKRVDMKLDPRYAGLHADIRRVGFLSGHIHHTSREDGV